MAKTTANKMKQKTKEDNKTQGYNERHGTTKEERNEEVREDTKLRACFHNRG